MLTIGVTKDCTAVEVFIQLQNGTTSLTIPYEMAYLYADLLGKCSSAVENKIEQLSESEGE